MSYTVKRIIGDPFPEWGLYENGRLIGKAFSAEKAAEFAASHEMLEALEEALKMRTNSWKRRAEEAIAKARGMEA